MNVQWIQNTLKGVTGLAALSLLVIGLYHVQWPGAMNNGLLLSPQDSTVTTTVTTNQFGANQQIATANQKQKQIIYANSKTQYLRPISDDLIKSQMDAAFCRLP